MLVRYLYNCNDSIFDVVGAKIGNDIKCSTLLINPLCRFINNEDDSKLLNKEIQEYTEFLNTLIINKNIDIDAEILENHAYFLFGTKDNGENNISFAYSELFKISEDDLEILIEKSINLSKTITSTINNNREDIETNLEADITEMLIFNHAPLEDGVAEVFGVVLIPQEDNLPNFTIKCYCDPNNQIDNTELITTMFDTLVPEIAVDLKSYNFFMLTEPTTIIKLGISTNGEYLISTNDVLINQLDENKLNFIKTILVETYESL